MEGPFQYLRRKGPLPRNGFASHLRRQALARLALLPLRQLHERVLSITAVEDAHRALPHSVLEEVLGSKRAAEELLNVALEFREIAAAGPAKEYVSQNVSTSPVAPTWLRVMASFALTHWENGFP